MTLRDSPRDTRRAVDRRHRLATAIVTAILGASWLAAGPASAAVTSTRGSSTEAGRAAAAASFCDRMSVSRISAIVGVKVTLLTSETKGTILACLYEGIPDNMSIETQTKIPKSSTATLAAAERGTLKQFPAGQKLTFSAVSSLGLVAFTWTGLIGGKPFSGLNDYHGTTGYFVEMGGHVDLTALKKLVALAIAAA